MLLLTGATNAPTEAPLATWPVALQSKVVKLSRSFDGEFSFYVKDLGGGARYAYNAATPIYLASVIKIFALRELYRQVDAGTIHLEEELVVAESTPRDGAGEVKRAAPGTRYTLDSLVTRMIVESDNTATDLILDRIDLARVNESLRGRGFGPITSMLDVRRKIYGQLSPKALELTPQQVFELSKARAFPARIKRFARLIDHPPRWTVRDLNRAYAAYYASLENSAPLEEVGKILEEFARCEGLSEKSCQALIGKLKLCKTGTARLRAGLPARFALAHKTGTQHRRVCDVGLIYPPEGEAVVIAACAKNFRNRAAAEKLLARLSRATYDALLAPARAQRAGRPQRSPAP